MTTLQDRFLGCMLGLALGHTLCAMTGAISGAHLGAGALPATPLATLEDGPKGRTYLRLLAERLAAAVGA